MSPLRCENIQTSGMPINPFFTERCPVLALVKYLLVYPYWLKGDYFFPWEFTIQYVYDNIL